MQQNGQGQQGFFALGTGDPKPKAGVCDDDAQHQKKVQRLAPSVKYKAEEQQNAVLPPQAPDAKRRRQKIQQQRGRQKPKQKGIGRKKHSHSPKRIALRLCCLQFFYYTTFF